MAVGVARCCCLRLGADHRSCLWQCGSHQPQLSRPRASPPVYLSIFTCSPSPSDQAARRFCTAHSHTSATLGTQLNAVFCTPLWRLIALCPCRGCKYLLRPHATASVRKLPFEFCHGLWMVLNLEDSSSAPYYSILAGGLQAPCRNPLTHPSLSCLTGLTRPIIRPSQRPTSRLRHSSSFSRRTQRFLIRSPPLSPYKHCCLLNTRLHMLPFALLHYFCYL